MMYFESMADVSIHAKQSKPNRYESFREQTSTIDGLVQWINEPRHPCRFCANQSRLNGCGLPIGDKYLEEKCIAGIKAYWESECE